MLFTIPWLPASKKNDVSVVPITKAGKTFYKPVKGARTVRQEHAVGVLFSACRAAQAGRTLWAAFDKILSFCVRRAKGGERVGEKTLAQYDEHREDTGPLVPAENDVAMDVTLRIGKTQSQDRVDVQIRDLGKPPKRARTGRKRDAINVPALIADALKNRAFDDDKQIIELHLRVRYDVDRTAFLKMLRSVKKDEGK